MESEIRPLANEFWERAEFPEHAIPRYGRWMTEIFRGELPLFPHPDPLLMGLIAFRAGPRRPQHDRLFWRAFVLRGDRGPVWQRSPTPAMAGGAAALRDGGGMGDDQTGSR